MMLRFAFLVCLPFCLGTSLRGEARQRVVHGLSTPSTPVYDVYCSQDQSGNGCYLCCRTTLSTGATSCRISASNAPTLVSDISSSPYSAGPSDVYRLFHVPGFGGKNFQLVGQVEEAGGTVHLIQYSAWSSGGSWLGSAVEVMRPEQIPCATSYSGFCSQDLTASEGCFTCCQMCRSTGRGVCSIASTYSGTYALYTQQPFNNSLTTGNYSVFSLTGHGGTTFAGICRANDNTGEVNCTLANSWCSSTTSFAFSFSPNLGSVVISSGTSSGYSSSCSMDNSSGYILCCKMSRTTGETACVISGSSAPGSWAELTTQPWGPAGTTSDGQYSLNLIQGTSNGQIVCRADRVAGSIACRQYMATTGASAGWGGSFNPQFDN